MTERMSQSRRSQRRTRAIGAGATIVGAIGLIASLLIPTAYAAETINQSAAFEQVDPGVPQEVVLDECDPINGQLSEVVLTVSADTSLSYQAENESTGTFAGDESITATVSVNLFLSGLGLSPALQVSDTLSDARDLGAPYDGTTDFGGTSGYTSPVQTASGSDSITFTGADLAQFIGTGTIAYQLNATAPSTFSAMNYGDTAFNSSPSVVGGVIEIACTFLQPSIDIEKATNGDDADDTAGPTLLAGDTVTWTYVVTNDGELPLTNVAVVDDQIGAITCPQDTLAVGESMTCEATGLAVVGEYENNAVVTGDDPGGNEVTDADPSHYVVVPAPSIDIEKATNGDDADDTAGPTLLAGDTVTWTYVVTNDGNVPLTSVAVVDDQIGAITCPQDTLAVGESMTCEATGIAVVGEYENNAVVTGDDPDGTEVTDADPSHYTVVPNPGIDIEKATNGDDADDTAGPTLNEGDTVTWTYVVTNTGNVPLINVAVVDDQIGAITCPQDTLAVDETMTCEATGIAVVGEYENNAVVTGDDPDGTEVTDADPSHYNVVAAPAIDIEKDTNGDQADDTAGPTLTVGDAVTWTYVVTNTGNVDLTDVAVTDDVEGDVTCPETALAVDESMTCTLDGVAELGDYENNATVTGVGTDPDATPVTDADPSHYTGVAAPDPGMPAIDIEKDTNGDQADDTAGPTLTVGDAVTWTYVVTNTGDVDLTDVAVTDDVEGDVTCPETALAVDESMTCTLDGVAELGDYENNATVTGVGTDPDATPVTDADPSHYTGVAAPVAPMPGIDIEKATNGSDSDVTGQRVGVGTAVTWTYVVTNTGDTALTDVVVTDDVEGVVPCPQATLAIGEAMTCVLSGVVREGNYINNATVTANDPDGTPVTDDDPSTYVGIPPLQPQPPPTVVVPPTVVPPTPAPPVPTPIVVHPAPPAVKSPAPNYGFGPEVPKKTVPVTPKKPELALTGGESFTLGLVAFAVLGAGMVTLGISYRREEEAIA